MVELGRKNLLGQIEGNRRGGDGLARREIGQRKGLDHVGAVIVVLNAADAEVL